MFDGNSCGVLSAIHEQSEDINRGVDRGDEEQGAGDQGMMFGYATNETENYMPLALDLSHRILIELAEMRREGTDISYLRPDSKSQVTIEYDDDNTPKRIEAIVISTQHDDFDEEKSMLEKIRKDLKTKLIPRVVSKLPTHIQELFNDKINYHINPTGKFVIGGPHGDTGLTGRKIIVDTYGGAALHGGGAFSGKDPSKVDRSAAYAARYLAKNIVASGIVDKAVIQLSYAIGVSQPLSIYLDIFQEDQKLVDQITKVIQDNFDLSPRGIRNKLELNKPIYKKTAAYGHFGRAPEADGSFSWEKIDMVNVFKKEV